LQRSINDLNQFLISRRGRVAGHSELQA